MTDIDEEVVGQKPALVFGASGQEGRAVIEGFVESSYSPVYGFTRNTDEESTTENYLTDALGCILLTGDIANPDDVRKALVSTKAQAIFVISTTQLPGVMDDLETGYRAAMDEEYDVIVQFFDVLKAVHAEDKIERSVVFATKDNVEEMCQQVLKKEKKVWITPLDDGSVVPHYSAKGRAGAHAVKSLEKIEGLNLVLMTTPFFYSNFLAFFAPLPNKNMTQWELSACFGDGATKIDMMSASDLGMIVPHLVADAAKYRGQNIRVAAEQISMDEIAQKFSDLFGKDVIYNPLLPSEVASLNFPSAPAMAQMCQFLGDARSHEHDVALTAAIMEPRKPQSFQDWLLTHSDSEVFSRVGLDIEAPEILSVCVFGATSVQGRSVVKGLLADSRKAYTIRATTRRLDSDDAKSIKALDPEHVELVYADFDDIHSCEEAVDGMDGVFLVTDFYEGSKVDLETEERHTKNIIDACEGRVKHLVFSTMESVDHVNSKLPEKELLEFSPKARAAAYARTKSLSATFVVMPCYTEVFFDMLEKRIDENGNEKLVLQIPMENDGKVMCMSVEELGHAVANIFDSYECYSGHEIGLVTDFVSVKDVRDMMQDAFQKSSEDFKQEIETEVVDAKEWIKARDTYMKDLGQLFASMSHSDFVKHRHSVAKTFKLVPSAKKLRRWIEENAENPSFREKLGLR